MIVKCQTGIEMVTPARNATPNSKLGINLSKFSYQPLENIETSEDVVGEGEQLQNINKGKSKETGNKENRESFLTPETENKSDDSKNLGISRPRSR